jgi:DNA-binding MarR family transcriptional regulator
VIGGETGARKRVAGNIPFDNYRYHEYTSPVPKRLPADLRRVPAVPSREQEVFLSLLRTAESLARGLEQALKPSGLTATQYNVLRILRGAGPGGLPCREIAARMITHDPDVTRLLDRLERLGLVERQRNDADRRVVTARITPEGQRLLAALDDPIAALHRRQLAHLSPEHLAMLIDLLQRVREAPL